MKVNLSLQEKLKDERVNRHMTLAELEEATGISHSTLGKYESDNCTDISPFNLAKLAKYYGVSMDYLMGLTENKNHPNTALYELHLSDSAVDVLKSGKLNNRLLSEMVCHPGFLRLMTDIEICVDRIADMRIKDMNDELERTRLKLMDEMGRDENDLNVRVSELAQINEDIFYNHVIHQDLDSIVRDIREAHKDDFETADQQTDGQVLAKDMEPILLETLNYGGSLDAKRAYMVCRLLDINYDKLPEDDQKAFARVLRKSPKLASIISQRGKAMPPQRRKRKRR